ncbi:MAG: hypothetical protein KJZ86_15440 [Caldilineaceae bacterium]|mgnify:CR=1 FL=1|nr:hypothetical protein [Caldilineaceae bacterium]HRJ43214.1 hypothetical protein [Caldilineaceae bacterium]
MSTQQTPTVGASPQDLERVRDILFGGIVRDYDARFATLQRDLERLQKALERTNEQLAAQESAQNKKLQETRQELQASTDELRAETRSDLDRLTNEKVDREQLGNLFIEVGNQIKGSGMLTSVLDSLLQTTE